MFSIPGWAQSAPDAKAKFLSGPAFAISAEDEAAGIEGTMKVAANIDSWGNVTRAYVYVGPSWPCSTDIDKRVFAVMRSAEDVVKTYKFAPAIENGKPVESAVGVSLTLRTARERADAEAKKTGARNVSGDPIPINGGNINGKAKLLAKPAYPLEARRERAAGSVNVQIVVDEQGKVKSAQAVDGSPLLQFAARAAACESKFAPIQLSGVPVKVSGTLTYNFVP
jgi:TonB family protein